MHRPRVTRLFRSTCLVASIAVGIGWGPSSGPAVGAPDRAPLGSPASTPEADVPPNLAAYYTQTLAWSSCQDGLTCTWLTVPLDYAMPSGDTIRLRVAKEIATGPAASRQGSVVINPGGPGGSGVDFTAYVARVTAAEVAEQFDIVGFDPRGVGQSTPITCLSGRQTTVWLETEVPITRADERRFMSSAATIPRGCLDKSPASARHVGSENTIKDMDILRAALGDAHLNWLGFSYGTYLGTLYAEEFPDRVGRMVLDGAIDPRLDAMRLSEGQSRGFQKAITRFAADCGERPSCPYSGGKAGVLRGINDLLGDVERRPMPTSSRRVLTQASALTAVFFPMYTTSLWPALRHALAQTTRNDGSGMLALADYANDRTGPNTYGSNMISAFYSISCWDLPAPPGASGLRKAARRWSANAPVPDLAISFAWGNAPCTEWYGHSARKTGPASSTTTAPILVIGTTYDPATPYWWAVALSRQLTTSTLLTFRGDGHTAYGSGSPCIDSAVSGYLLTGALPAAGTVCR